MTLTDNQYERIEVTCYSGYKANERPKAFVYRKRHYEIAEILDRWYEGGLAPTRPAVDYFKVRTADGLVFMLRYLSLFDAWSVSVREETAACQPGGKD